MSKQSVPVPPKKKKNPGLQLVAGGTAGLVESSICHPLDTIKTRMQLRRQQSTMQAVRARSSLHEPGFSTRAMSSMAEPRLSVLHSGSGVHEPGIQRIPVGQQQGKLPTRAPIVTASLGPIGTARRIIQREGFFSLYKGLSAVYTGIIPKMAVRFLTFEQYREALQTIADSPTNGAEYSTPVNFTAGLASGLTEAIVIVTPAEVCKIRMQSQFHSLMDPAQMARRKYRNVFQTAFTLVREEGFSALYKGLVPTMLRQVRLCTFPS